VPASQFLRALLTAPGPSGREAIAARVWRDAAERFASSVSSDVMGSSVARVDGRGDGPLVAVVGHIDEIGLIITRADDDGFLWFAPVGGWDPQVLIAQRVEILGRDGRVAGVIGRRPIHLLKEEDRKKVPDVRELHIDIGANSRDDALTRVREGDVAVVAGDPIELPNDRLVSRSLDNRLGCYVALEAARLVSEAGGAPGTVAAVAASQEEIGFAGSRTTAFSLAPDVAIVVDVTHATDAPGVDVKQVGGKHGLGSGPVLGAGATIHPVIFDLLRDTAEQEGIPYAIEVSGRGTGTDADAVNISRAGVPTGIVSLPLRYMHSPTEMVELADVEAAARLIAAFAQRLDGTTSFAR
jgi:putative aminopeptidase FrvX